MVLREAMSQKQRGWGMQVAGLKKKHLHVCTSENQEEAVDSPFVTGSGL